MVASLDKLVIYLPAVNFGFLDNRFPEYSSDDLQLVHQNGFYFTPILILTKKPSKIRAPCRKIDKLSTRWSGINYSTEISTCIKNLPNIWV